jgi:hypothetical protein
MNKKKQDIFKRWRDRNQYLSNSTHRRKRDLSKDSKRSGKCKSLVLKRARKRRSRESDKRWRKREKRYSDRIN